MLISVVIPAYNEEKYLAKTLESVYAQSHPDFEFEVIVVDADSTDKTAEIGKRYGARVIKVEKRTPGFGRQKGIEAAGGEIVVCLDADTLAPKDLLKNIVLEFNNDASLVGITGIIKGYGGSFHQRLIYGLGNEIFARVSLLLGKPGLHGQSFAVKKTAFMKIGGFRTEIYSNEDTDLGCRLSKIGKVKILTKVVGISSIRRMKENLIASSARSIFSYLRVIWGLPFRGKKEKEPFPTIR